MNPIHTTDIDGNPQTFYYTSEINDEGNISVMVFERDEVEMSFYQATFTKIGDNLFESTMMTTNGLKQFMRKGIPEATILAISNLYNVAIRSSLKEKSGSNYMVPQAIRVWQRLGLLSPQRFSETDIRFSLQAPPI